ncbi:hypothetical protein [Acidocella sp. KAb 2-4]|uniref:hypothetical protein n=1 Tax=Acidocella sp. KAb 2-4 TaxID=2885158 RepID=UPI001D0785B6|nr:hypothetical protein [Acidocella sp. KAb 2-4]MCB5945598.1 hypothetical protein [Acidocella sp. KAb 2-4]
MFTLPPRPARQLRQQPTSEAQIWLNYSYAPLNTASLGVSGTLGGCSSVNGALPG